MSIHTITVTTCDRCLVEQRSNDTFEPDRRLIQSITKISVNIPFLEAKREKSTLPYDWKKTWDLCPACRKGLKETMETFLRGTRYDS